MGDSSYNVSQKRMLASLLSHSWEVEHHHRTWLVAPSSLKECINSVKEMKVFSTLNASSQYWKTEIHEHILDKTTFTSDYNLWGFTRMVLGMNNSSLTFQRAMIIKESLLRRQIVLVYLRDRVVFFKLPIDHNA